MPNPIIQIAQRQRTQLDNLQTQLVNQLTTAYVQSISSLQPQIDSLQSEILRLTSNETELSSYKLFRLARYQSLQTQIIEQLQKYGNFADLTVTSQVPELVTLAGNNSLILVRDQSNSSLYRKAIVSAWDKLNPEQIETALVFLAQDSPFHQNLTSNLGEGIANRIENAIVQAVIVGKNPRVLGRQINRELGLGLAWSLNSARTAQIYSYRTATHFNYNNNSNIVGSWTWLSALDRRTCSSCLSKHGSTFPLEQILNDHHQGRCTAIPNVINAERYGIEPTVLETGENWFNQQPRNIQEEIFGPSKLAAYLNNEFQFSELSTPYENNIYGTMLRETTLRELLNEQ